MTDKIPEIVPEAEQQPKGRSKISTHAGLPHKQDGEKMPHENFQSKMTDKLGC